MDDADLKCGCADALCGGVGATDGEEHERRWVVYEIPTKKKKDKKKKN